MAARVFVATEAPSGWLLGRWSEVKKGVWEERKNDEPAVRHEFEEVDWEDTPGSNTVRLRMLGTDTEVMLLERTAQVFVSGNYFGEYRGHWEVGGKAVAPSGAAPGPMPAAGGPDPFHPDQGYPGGPPAAAPASAAQRPAAIGAGAYPPQGTPAQAPERASVTGMSTYQAGGGGSMSGSMAAMAPPSCAPEPKPVLDASPETAKQLFQAAEGGQADAVKSLLAGKADPDATPQGKSSPLLAATQKKHTAVIAELLKGGANPFHGGSASETPILVCFQKDDKTLLKDMVKASMNLVQTSVTPSSIVDLSKVAEYHPPETFEEIVEEVSSMGELRDWTAKICNLSSSFGSSGGAVAIPSYEETNDEVNENSQAIREGACKEFMRTLLRNSKQAQLALQEAAEHAEAAKHPVDPEAQ